MIPPLTSSCRMQTVHGIKDNNKYIVVSFASDQNYDFYFNIPYFRIRRTSNVKIFFPVKYQPCNTRRVTECDI